MTFDDLAGPTVIEIEEDGTRFRYRLMTCEELIAWKEKGRPTWPLREIDGQIYFWLGARSLQTFKRNLE